MHKVKKKLPDNNIESILLFFVTKTKLLSPSFFAVQSFLSCPPLYRTLFRLLYTLQSITISPAFSVFNSSHSSLLFCGVLMMSSTALLMTGTTKKIVNFFFLKGKKRTRPINWQEEGWTSFHVFFSRHLRISLYNFTSRHDFPAKMNQLPLSSFFKQKIIHDKTCQLRSKKWKNYINTFELGFFNWNERKKMIKKKKDLNFLKVKMSSTKNKKIIGRIFFFFFFFDKML